MYQYIKKNKIKIKCAVLGSYHPKRKDFNCMGWLTVGQKWAG